MSDKPKKYGKENSGTNKYTRVTEGVVRKGGQNTSPKTARPSDPKGQGGSGAKSESK